MDIGGQCRYTTAVFYIHNFLTNEVQIIQKAKKNLNHLALGVKGDIPFNFLDHIPDNYMGAANHYKQPLLTSHYPSSISLDKENPQECSCGCFLQIL